MISAIKKLNWWEILFISILIFIMIGFLFSSVDTEKDLYENLSGIAQNFLADFVIAVGIWYVLDKRKEIENKVFLLEAISDELYGNYEQIADNKKTVVKRSPSIIYGKISTGVWDAVMQSTSPYKLIDEPDDVVELVQIYQQISLLLYYEKLFSDSYYIPSPVNVKATKQYRDRVVDKLQYHYGLTKNAILEFMKRDALGITTSDKFEEVVA